MDEHTENKIATWDKGTLREKGLDSHSTKWLTNTVMTDYEKSEENLERAKENLKSLNNQNLIKVDLRQ